MSESVIRKTFSLPPFIAKRLDEISTNTGYSQSNLALQALTAYMHTFEVEGSLHHWVEWLGKNSGMYECDDSDEEAELYEQAIKENNLK